MPGSFRTVSGQPDGGLCRIWGWSWYRLDLVRCSRCTGLPEPFEGKLARHHDGPTIVVSHHLPHPASLPEPHTDLVMDRGPDLWVHGHVRRAADYEVGRTRVICNPRGHADELSGFNPGLTVAARSPSG